MFPPLPPFRGERSATSAHLWRPGRRSRLPRRMWRNDAAQNLPILAILSSMTRAADAGPGLFGEPWQGFFLIVAAVILLSSA